VDGKDISVSKNNVDPVLVYLEHISKGMLFGMKFSQPIIPGLIAAFICFVIFFFAMPPKEETTELIPEEDD